MGKDREAIEMARRISQNCIDKIAGAMNPVGKIELPFMAFALHTILGNILQHLDKEQMAVYENMKELFDSECHTQRYDRREVGEEDVESNKFPQDTIREKNKKMG